MPRHAGSLRADRQRVRELKALQLRVVAGLTYQAIADTVLPCPLHEPRGLVGQCDLCSTLYADRGAAKRAVDRALAREYPTPTEAERENYVREQAAGLAALLGRAKRDALDTGNSITERVAAMNAAARLFERQARLLGLDARLRTDDDDALDAEIRALVDELSAGEG